MLQPALVKADIALVGKCSAWRIPKPESTCSPVRSRSHTRNIHCHDIPVTSGNPLLHASRRVIDRPPRRKREPYSRLHPPIYPHNPLPSDAAGCAAECLPGFLFELQSNGPLATPSLHGADVVLAVDEFKCCPPPWCRVVPGLRPSIRKIPTTPNYKAISQSRYSA